MKQMNILMLTPFHPPHAGGVEYYAKDLSEHLSGADHTITILTADIPAGSDKKSHHFRVVSYPAFELIHNYPIPKFWTSRFQKILQTEKQNNPDIIITHTRFFFSSLLGMLLAYSLKIPRLHIEHGSSFVQSKNPLIAVLAWIYDHIIGKQVLEQADKVIAVSHSVQKFIQALAPKIHPTVIYRGFDIEKIQSAPVNHAIWGEHSEKIKIFYIGRIVPSKGIDELLLALSKISLKNWVCLLVGDEQTPGKYAKKIKSLGLQENIILLGSKPWIETMGILRGADIFINPSHSEGIPTTVIEAALCGIPTIATDVGGTIEISESITLIPPKDTNAIQKSLEKTIRDLQEECQIANQSKESVQEKFSWKNTLPRFLSTLESLKP